MDKLLPSEDTCPRPSRLRGSGAGFRRARVHVSAPELPAELATDGTDGPVTDHVTRNRSRWSAEGDKVFGDADAKVYSGIEVPPEWVTAADFAVIEMVSKQERDAAVEGGKTWYHYACTHGVWTTFGKKTARKKTSSG